MSLILDGTNGLSDVDGSAATPAIRGSDANTGVFFDSDVVGLSTDGTERVRVDASGNVGIGTSSPKSDVGLSLHLFNSASTGTVASNSYLLVESSTRNAVIEISGSATSTNGLNFSDTPGTVVAGIASSTADQNLFFRTGGTTERARIDSSGTLLVGTTSTGGATLGAWVNKDANSGRFTAVGDNSASGALFLGLRNDTQASVFIVRPSGNVQNANNSYGSISDAKVKENIVDATPKLDKLNQVRVVNYNLIGSEQKQLGVIAQELEQIFPGMVEESLDRDAEGNDLGTTTKAVKYSVFVPMLIKAIQELKGINDAQAQIITALTARVEALEGAQG